MRENSGHHQYIDYNQIIGKLFVVLVWECSYQGWGCH